MTFVTCYNPLPISFTHGKGLWLWDEAGKSYLDAMGGIAVCGLGHAYPAVTEAIQQQAAQVIHTSNVFRIAKQEQLAAQLTAVTEMEQVFFCNSGAEANETAIKIARLYGHQRNVINPSIIVMEKAFHGRTLGTLTASGSRKVQAGFEPLVPGFIRAPYNNIPAIHTIAKNSEDVVAIMVEPIQGEGGIQLPDADYLTQLRAICDAHHWLLIIDEIQTGMGRTGKFFAYQHANIKPDIVTVAKGLANGVPIGACLMRGNACNLLQPGNHGSTFGGNPLACSAALAVISSITQNKLLENATEMGHLLQQKLQQALSGNPHVLGIRGQGLMIGIELDRPCRNMMHNGLAHGLLFNVTADKVVRLLPALIITPQEVDEIVTRLTACIVEFCNTPV